MKSVLLLSLFAIIGWIYTFQNSYEIESEDFIGFPKLRHEERGQVKYIPGIGKPTTYQETGYLLVNEDYNSNLFYYFVQSSNKKIPSIKIPLMLWLQGGPGGSSLWGAFAFIGPYILKEHHSKLKLEKNPYAWTDFAHVIFVDQPVGTGFSFTEDEAGYSVNDETTAGDLYKGLSEFFKRRPDLVDNPFFIFGNSYAGKYTPSIAHRIIMENEKVGAKRMNLQGIGLGNSWTDPLQIAKSWGPRMYEIGLISEDDLHSIEAKVDDLIPLIEADNVDSLRKANEVGEGIEKFLGEIVGGMNRYDYRGITEKPKGFINIDPYFKRKDVRKSFHVNKNYVYNENAEKVEEFLKGDIYKPISPLLPKILENVKVFTLTGIYDIGCNVIALENMYKEIDWDGKDSYQAAEKKIWKVPGIDGASWGWVKTGGNLSFLASFTGGHEWLSDHPQSGVAAVKMMLNTVLNVEV
eukprot:snap_masked-scaffold_3-processed-gene-0.24-mRNA-1 protein AED:0.10 eAED:0.11 QI:0/-1/0/1/-1/1/1/0/463